MEWDSRKKHYVLTSGKTLYANGAILGLSPLWDDLYEGYDGQLSYPEGSYFTKSERLEIMRYMISIWTRWGHKKSPSRAQAD